MRITKVEPLTWKIHHGGMSCCCCEIEDAKFKVALKDSNGFKGIFPVCNSCKNLDAESIYTGIAKK